MAYQLIQDDCFEWMRNRDANSITAIVTDPPYGVREYSKEEIMKKRNGRGGIWRIPPSFDGHKRAPLPRFSVINESPKERENVYRFFYDWACLAYRILVPGAHVFIATTPLLSDILSKSLRDAGFERRGEIIRTVSTLRGGDRPKGAEEEFHDISVIPRGLWEPWGLFRKPISERTIADNLRIWHAGALRRKPDGSPFCDFIKVKKTSPSERKIAPHPSLKPQELMRQLVYASLPLGTGMILDPFAGSGSTIAAADYYDLDCIGIEQDPKYYQMAIEAVPILEQLL